MVPRTILTLVVGVLGALPARAPSGEAPATTLSVMTYNIRFDNPADSVHAWPNRRAEVLAFLRSQSPDILCVQEALAPQIRDLQDGLALYAHRGVGRDDGLAKGEYCAIFYNEQRFDCLGDSTIWLSPTPAAVSRGWDAALPRIVTWVRLIDKSSGAEFCVFNTHFDHAGPDARANSASLVRALVASAGARAILAGDFNCTEIEPPYAILTAARETDAPLRDARTITKNGPFGPLGTFCGFAPAGEIQGPRIDYIFVTEGIAVNRYETFLAARREGFLSDHLPVIATLTLPKSDETVN